MLRILVSYSFLALLVLATLAQLVRDRALVLMLLMFVPVLPVAALAVIWDVLLRGRSLRLRWSLSAVAVGCGALAVAWQWRPALAPEPSGHNTVRIVQWNAMWGSRSSQGFRRILEQLDAAQPDIIFLSEAPEMVKFEYAWNKAHPGWSLHAASNHGRGSYWFNLAVVSRYPAQQRGVWTLARGRLALFEVAHPARTLRIAMVDLLSSPLSPRSPSIEQAVRIIDARAQAGEPIDLVVGDFNTPARFLGFDALQRAAGGFRRAALWSGAWSATWPSFSPLALYDIDHVWVSTRLRIRRTSFFSTLASDHRGQRVELAIP